MKTFSLSHVAMSVPPGTLTDTYRKEVLDFYRELFDWREIEDLRLPDRLTIAIGRHFYINLREKNPNAATTNGYEHFGVLVRSAEYLEDVRTKLRVDHPDVLVEDQERGQFRFQHLLPFAVEVQYFPDVT